MLAPPALRKIHPLGKSPVLEVEGKMLAESGAIIEILADRHGQGTLAPERGSDAWEQYLYWLHYAEGSVMSPLVLKLVLSKMGPLGWPAQGYVNGQLKLHGRYLDGALSKQPFLVDGAFSAADIAMSFPIEALVARGPKDLPLPHLRAFLERIHARPAYVHAVERGGSLDIL